MCGNMEYMYCNAPLRLELADGRMAWIRAGSKATTCQGAPATGTVLASLPASEIAWAREQTGQGTTVIDNTAMINAGIAISNAKFSAEQMRWPIPTGAGGSAGAAGAGGGGTGTGGAGGAGQGSGGSVAGNGPRRV